MILALNSRILNVNYFMITQMSKLLYYSFMDTILNISRHYFVLY